MTSPPVLVKTVYAHRCVELTRAFSSVLARSLKTLSFELTSVEQSTGGGARTLQHIVLTSADGATLVMGSINFIENTAELRTLGCALEICRQRLGNEVAIPAREYVEFLDEARAVLEKLGVKVTIATQAKRSTPLPAPLGSERSSQPAPAARFAFSRIPLLVVSTMIACGAIGWVVSRW